MFYLLIASESTANIYNVPRQVTKKSTKQFNFPRVFPWFSPPPPATRKRRKSAVQTQRIQASALRMRTESSQTSPFERLGDAAQDLDGIRWIFEEMIFIRWIIV
jgi:hypothetical protein